MNSSACSNDSQALNSAQRKANDDYHPDKQGTLIKDSQDKFNISGQSMPGGNISFGMVLPPQLKPEYANKLAFRHILRHIQGIFSLITSSNPRVAEGTRLLPCKHFSIFNTYAESDWGNPQLQEIISRTNGWCCPAKIITANGFFKAIMKHHSEAHLGWFWALEWNKSYRVIGTIGETNILNDLPELDWIRVNNDVSTREEIPLNSMQDTLFTVSICD